MRFFFPPDRYFCANSPPFSSPLYPGEHKYAALPPSFQDLRSRMTPQVLSPMIERGAEGPPLPPIGRALYAIVRALRATRVPSPPWRLVTFFDRVSVTSLSF